MTDMTCETLFNLPLLAEEHNAAIARSINFPLDQPKERLPPPPSDLPPYLTNGDVDIDIDPDVFDDSALEDNEIAAASELMDSDAAFEAALRSVDGTNDFHISQLVTIPEAPLDLLSNALLFTRFLEIYMLMQSQYFTSSFWKAMLDITNVMYWFRIFCAYSPRVWIILILGFYPPTADQLAEIPFAKKAMGAYIKLLFSCDPDHPSGVYLGKAAAGLSAGYWGLEKRRFEHMASLRNKASRNAFNNIFRAYPGRYRVIFGAIFIIPIDPTSASAFEICSARICSAFAEAFAMFAMQNFDRKSVAPKPQRGNSTFWLAEQFSTFALNYNNPLHESMGARLAAYFPRDHATNKQRRNLRLLRRRLCRNFPFIDFEAAVALNQLKFPFKRCAKAVARIASVKFGTSINVLGENEDDFMQRQAQIAKSRDDIFKRRLKLFKRSAKLGEQQFWVKETVQKAAVKSMKQSAQKAGPARKQAKKAVRAEKKAAKAAQAKKKGKKAANEGENQAASERQAAEKEEALQRELEARKAAEELDARRQALAAAELEALRTQQQAEQDALEAQQQATAETSKWSLECRIHQAHWAKKRAETDSQTRRENQARWNLECRINEAYWTRKLEEWTMLES